MAMLTGVVTVRPSRRCVVSATVFACSTTPCIWSSAMPLILTHVRLIVARCEVRYSGRLDALLPEALRLLMIKSDGSVLVHADTGGYKPQNWMTPPTVIEESDGLIVVRKHAGKTEDRLDIKISEVISDVTHDMGEAAELEKD